MGESERPSWQEDLASRFLTLAIYIQVTLGSSIKSYMYDLTLQKKKRTWSFAFFQGCRLYLTSGGDRGIIHLPADTQNVKLSAISLK